MQPEKWNNAVDVFHAVRDTDDGQRTKLLNSLCGGNHSLRIVVEQMLRNDQSSSTFLGRSPVESIAASGARPKLEAVPSARFGRYEVIGPLARGGMGEVWEARDTELHRKVALKFLAAGTSVRTEEHLTREARVASALNHPNIVTIYEVIRFSDTPIIAMELVEGEPLRNLCGTPQPVERVVHLGQQIARALAAAHKADLIHRDIKPENVLVRTDGYVKVVDFGLAGSPANEYFADRAYQAGTPRYMSPEQSRAELITPATDVFSLGLVVYELATGHHAFPGRSPFETAQAIQTAEPEPFPSVPVIPLRLRQLITAMLAKDPAVRPCAAEVALELGKIPPLLTRPEKSFWPMRSMAAGVLAVLAAPAVWLGINGRTRNSEQLKVRPLTSQPGWERRPAISPDGKSIAYTWSERLDGPGDIYVKRIDQKSPVKLTASQSGELGYLTWSPDGRRIAFLRGGGRSDSIYSIEPSGGAEQKILDLRRGNLSCALDWSPDGHSIAFTDQMPNEDRMAAYIYDLRTGDKRPLTSPPAGVWGDWSPAFSPDGRTIAFKRVTGFWADELYVVPTAGGTPRKLTNIRRGIWGFAWETDGKSLIVSCQRGSTQFGIWRFFLKDSDNPELIQQGGADAIMPASSRRTRRAAWVSQVWDLNVYRMSLNGSSPPLQVIASTLRDQNPESAPDGTIAWISDRSGSRDIWIARSDGSGQVQVTNFNGPQIDHLQWSHDGRTLAFDSRPEGQSAIFLMQCDTTALTCGKPKALTAAGVAESPSWSADDRFIYFTSRGKGQYTIWKMPSEGGEPMAVIGNAAVYCRESRDGKWLYFTRADGNSFWRIPAPAYGSPAGGKEELVIGDPYKVQATGWTLSADEILFIDRPVGQRRAAIRGYGIATKQMRTITPLTEVFPDRGDITVSVTHDGRTILYSQLDRSGSNVIVAENVH